MGNEISGQFSHSTNEVTDEILLLPTSYVVWIYETWKRRP